MTVHKVLRIGHPLLQQPAVAIHEFGTKPLNQLMIDLRDTMQAYGGVGLAAPQIGVSQQVVIFEINENPRYPDAESIPFTLLINPTIIPLDDIMSDGWEGCLSVPGLRGLVPRHDNIKYTGFDIDGQYFERFVSGFHARVVQHECDHLRGVLYPQRMTQMDKFGFIEELIIAGHLSEVPSDAEVLST